MRKYLVTSYFEYEQRGYRAGTVHNFEEIPDDERDDVIGRLYHEGRIEEVIDEAPVVAAPVVDAPQVVEPEPIKE